MDAGKLISAIGQDQYQAIQSSSLPKIVAMTLLLIWEAGSRTKLKRLAQSNQLLPILKGKYGDALEHANDLRGSHMNLTPAECLTEAGIPLTL